jgi:phosphinothricin acetyltransferase
MQIRDADDRDQADILEIYNDAVLNTTAVWNEAPRTEQEHAQWFAAKHAQGHPVLVAIVDERVAGFCSYGPFRAWYGYRFSVEGSIYVAAEFRRRGIARQLLAALIARAQSQNLHAIVAGIEAGNAASIRLHEQAGFRIAGCLHEVGFKFGRWLDLVFMERLLPPGGGAD